MSISFCKMQSLGNDFVMIDLAQFSAESKFSTKFFQKISDRNFGIGCDLVVLYEIIDSKSNQTSVNVQFFNPDGSEAEMCGNAARCVGLLMRLLKKTSSCLMRAGRRQFEIRVENEDKISVVWDSGIQADLFDISKLNASNFRFETEKLEVENVFQVDVANPHLVIFVKNMPSFEVIKEIGRKLESNSIFPHKTNVGFAKKISDDLIELVVFERGAGLTLACGSGALAAAAAAAAEKGLKARMSRINVRQRGGNLTIDFLDDGKYTQTGAAAYVFSGSIDEQPDFFSSGHGPGKMIIYTDGACSGNPGSGGWAAVIIDGEKTAELFGKEANTTNNRMELTAVIKALESVGNSVSEPSFAELRREKFEVSKAEIELYTDSQYVKNGITKWINNWVKNGWKNSDKKPVKNQDLWKRLLEVSKDREIRWRWVRGHGNDKLNERADALARRQCE